jgi:hypothetical protein
VELDFGEIPNETDGNGQLDSPTNPVEPEREKDSHLSLCD